MISFAIRPRENKSQNILDSIAITAGRQCTIIINSFPIRISRPELQPGSLNSLIVFFRTNRKVLKLARASERSLPSLTAGDGRIVLLQEELLIDHVRETLNKRKSGHDGQTY
jgi:hypothetical protein